MALNSELCERVAAAIPHHSFISEALWEDCNEHQRNRRRDLAEAVLAALGLDDLDAFVEEAWGHYSHPDEDEPESAEIDAMRRAIVAAFNRSATDSTGGSDG